MQRTWAQRITKALARLFAWPLALVILFEEWGWEPLQRAWARLIKTLGLHWIEPHIRALPPYAALALFLVPTLMLLPVKLLALWLIGHGQIVLGTLVIVCAKIVGTAIVARLFTLTQASLMRLAWFAALYGKWLRFKSAVLAHVRASWPGRWARVARRRCARRIRQWRSPA